ncbi:MAG: homocysteine S-methyltransferase family protein, partial [Thermoanaerobaculia bacterium]
MPQPDRTAELRREMEKRILIIDGAMGTMIQRFQLDESAFRGSRFADSKRELKGNNEALNLTQPKVIEEIHREYLAAGADIIETNTFNAQAYSLADYGFQGLVHEINVAAAQIARRAADSYSTPDRPRFVAGALGPTNRSTSLSPDVNNPAYRAATFDGMVAAYYDQVRGLVEGGVDILLAETAFDTLNLKAALFAIEKFFADTGIKLPVMASLTITDASGRTLSGQTVEAAWNSISDAPLLSVGINCALGAREMRPHIEELSQVAPIFITCYPNAGLPNALGAYDETPQSMSALLRDFAQNRWLNVVGGCCGTTPDHIRAIAKVVESLPPRVPSVPEKHLRLSGLEPLTIRRVIPSREDGEGSGRGNETGADFIMVGERTNVTGSKRFARLVKNGEYGAALDVALEQV